MQVKCVFMCECEGSLVHGSVSRWILTAAAAACEGWGFIGVAVEYRVKGEFWRQDRVDTQNKYIQPREKERKERYIYYWISGEMIVFREF